jgi:DNA polymerase-3 subunit chi
MLVDFYLLHNPSALCDFFACQLVEKAWKKGHRLYLHMDSLAHAQKMDALLWTFRKLSFIPHGLLDAKTNQAVSLGYPQCTLTPQQADICINLAHDVPLFFADFNRILEIVSDDESCKQAGRVRYRFYQQQPFTLATHIIQR